MEEVNPRLKSFYNKLYKSSLFIFGVTRWTDKSVAL